MSADDTLISDAFRTFCAEWPRQAEASMDAVRPLGGASALDARTQALGDLFALAALRLGGGVPFRAVQAGQAGASRDEGIGAILVGLPAAGKAVVQALPAALRACDQAA